MAKKELIPQLQIDWIRWNMDEDGKESSSPGGTWYRREFRYYNGWPIERFVWPAGRSRPIILRLTPSAGKLQTRNWHKTRDPIDVLPVPCIGVFTQFEDDYMEIDDDFHERLKLLMIKQVRMLVREEAPRVSAQAMCEGPSYHEDRLWNRLTAMEEAYAEYSYTFGLAWGRMPGAYRQEMHDDINGRKGAYLDPKAKARRERAQARRALEKALALS